MSVDPDGVSDHCETCNGELKPSIELTLTPLEIETILGWFRAATWESKTEYADGQSIFDKLGISEEQAGAR